MRLVDVVGADVVKWELTADHFQANGGSGSDPAGYTTTVVEVGTGTSEAEASDEENIVAELVTAANDNDGISLQLNGEAFSFDSDHDIYFGVKLEINDVDQTDILAGLCITDTTLLGGVSDGVYFESVDGVATVSTVAEQDSSETQSDSEGTLADDTAMTLEFYWNGAAVYFFIDGAQVGRVTANVPDDELLTPSIEFLTGEATANRCKIHWARAYQIGKS